MERYKKCLFLKKDTTALPKELINICVTNITNRVREREKKKKEARQREKKRKKEARERERERKKERKKERKRSKYNTYVNGEPGAPAQ